MAKSPTSEFFFRHKTLAPLIVFRSCSLPIDATSVKLKSSTALGSMVPESLKDILDRVGLSPNRWF
jgi:hypothetical protein